MLTVSCSIGDRIGLEASYRLGAEFVAAAALGDAEVPRHAQGPAAGLPSARALTIHGWSLLRFSWEDVMYDPDWVVEAVRAAIGGPAGHRNLVATAA